MYVSNYFHLFFQNDTREFIKSIKEALIVLNVFKNLNDSYQERLEKIEETIHVIDTVLIQGYFSVIEI